MNRTYRILLIILFAAGQFCPGFAGNHVADSLFRELYKANDLSKKIHIYLAISKAFQRTDPDSSLIVWKKAQILAHTLNSDKELGDVYFQAASFEVSRNHLDRAFNNFLLAIKYYGGAGDQDQIVRAKAMLGNICLARDSIASAMSYYMEVIDFLSKKEKTGSLLPNTLNNVGGIYIDAEEYSTAMHYYSKAIQLLVKIGDEESTINPLLNLGEAYISIGNLEQARYYITRAATLTKKYGISIDEVSALMSMGHLLVKEKKYPAALDTLYRGIEAFRNVSHGYSGPKNIQYSVLVVLIGETWMAAGNYDTAYRYSLEGYRIAKEMNQIKQSMLAAKLLSLIHKHWSHPDSALYYYSIYMDCYENLSKSRNLRAVKLMEIRQEFENRQKENELQITLAQSNEHITLVISVACVAVFIAVILILILMLKLEKQRKRQVETEKKSLHETLDFQNKELTTNVIYLARLNELVLSIAEKLENLDLEPDSKNSGIVKSIIGELKLTSSTDTWKEFEVRFQNVHIDFYKRLSERFPDLSPNELKMCAFLRLNMSTKEISSITYQSQDSIRMARSRLRQKLGITRDDNLVAFLSQF